MNPIDYPIWFILVSLFLFGSVFGSFLNACVHRFPQHTGLMAQLKGIWGRSACTRCKAEILARDNIPVVGWLLLRARCRSCKLPISARYPIVELCNGLLFVVVYAFELPRGLRTYVDEQCCYSHQLGPQMLARDVLGWTELGWMHLRFLFHMVLVEALLIASLTSIDQKKIPSGSTVPAITFAVIASTLVGQTFLLPIWWVHPLESVSRVAGTTGIASGGIAFAQTHPHWHGLIVSMGGLLAGAACGWLIHPRWFPLRESDGGSGLARVWLLAAVGAFLGWQAIVIVFVPLLLTAVVSASMNLLSRRTQPYPLAPTVSLLSICVVLSWSYTWPHAKPYFDVAFSLLPGTRG